MPLYEQRADGGITAFKGEVPEEAIMAMERADETAIVERLVSPFGQDNFMYSYPIKTKEGDKLVIGIGVDGAKEIAGMIGNIEVLADVRVEEKDDYFYGIVRARDMIRNVILIGVGRQCIFILDKGNNPTTRRDELAFVKSISKAQRNAILSVAPQEVVARAIARFAEQKKIKRLSPTPYSGPPSAGAPAASVAATTAGAQPAAVATPAPAPSAPAASVASAVDPTYYAPVVAAAKELKYEKDDMLKVLEVSSMRPTEWMEKGITPEGAVAKLKTHKEQMKKTVAEMLGAAGKVEEQATLLSETGQSAVQEKEPAVTFEDKVSPVVLTEAGAAAEGEGTSVSEDLFPEEGTEQKQEDPEAGSIPF